MVVLDKALKDKIQLMKIWLFLILKVKINKDQQMHSE